MNFMLRGPISLPKFVFVLLMVLVAICAWSLYGGASFSVVLFRLITAAIILQAIYFIGILMMVQKRKSIDSKRPSDDGV